jgi:heme-degrading monooxygenase HmoA
MILEVAVLDIIENETHLFEKDFAVAQQIISVQKGYAGHELQRCLEKQNRYILLVRWNNLEDHTIGFRRSSEYQDWKELLHKYYDPFPKVEHYELVYSNAWE